MLKKLLFSLLFIVPTSIKADFQGISGQWRGLNNADTSLSIDDNEAQDLSNVDITANGFGIKKRDGYAQYRTIGVSTWGIRGGYYFKDTAGVNTIINANSLSVYKSTNSLAYASFITTDTNGSWYDFTDSNGYLWRANSNRNEINRYDGTTLTWYPSHPKGDQIEATPTRLVISGTSANPNRLNYSKSGDFTTMATGPLDTDPFTEDVGVPGQAVTAIKYAFGGVLAWTKDSLSIVTAQTQYDLNPTIGISKTIGSDQPNSVIDDGSIVYWQAQDRHFYSYDGNSLDRISTRIKGSVDGFVKPTIKTWALTTQSDWNTGTVGTGLDTSVSSGSVVFATGTLIDDFSDGDYTASPAWVIISTPAGTSWRIGDALHGSQGNLVFGSTGSTNSSGSAYIRTPISFSTGSWKTTVPTNDIQADGVSTTYYICLTTKTDTNPYPCYRIRNNTLASGTWAIERTNAAGSVQGGSGTVSGMTVTSNMKIEISRTVAGVFYLGVTNANNVQLSTTITDTTLTSFTNLWFQVDVATLGGTNVTATVRFDDIYYHPISSTYTSVDYPQSANFASWSQSVFDNTAGGGSFTFSIYSDSDSSRTLATPGTYVSSQAFTSGNIPVLTSSTNIFYTALFERNLSTQTAVLNASEINYNDGTLTRTFGFVDKDGRIGWSVAEGTATSNNATYVYDRRFDSWLKYSIPMDSPIRYENSIYFGGVSTGVVYKYPSGNTDNTAAFTAYWRSKDFLANNLFQEKDYLTYSLLTKSQSGSNIDFVYTVNTTSAVTVNHLLTDTNTLHRINERMALGKMGTFINFKFGNDDADSPFEVYALQYEYKPRPWRILP